MGVARAVALLRSGADARYFIGVLEVLDRLEYVYLVTCFGGGLFVLVRALAEVRSITARRQLRWIAWGSGLGMTPFALGYALPWAIGVEPSLSMQLTAIPLGIVPLAYASAIVRYRLTDVEVIVKRALVYAAAPAAVGVIYVVLLQGFDRVVSEGSSSHNWVLAVVVTVIALLLAPWVKHTIQDVLDRAFYRDRFDYRRALVGFARDLNSDLDLNRLSERLVSRVMETLLVDRMALMIVDETRPHFASVRAHGFAGGHPSRVVTGIHDRQQASRRAHRGARRPDCVESICGGGCRVLARRRFELFHSVRVERGDDCGSGARTERDRRADQQRGHGIARCRRRTGRHGPRERAPVPTAAPQSRRARSASYIQ